MDMLSKKVLFLLGFGRSVLFSLLNDISKATSSGSAVKICCHTSTATPRKPPEPASTMHGMQFGTKWETLAHCHHHM